MDQAGFYPQAAGCVCGEMSQAMMYAADGRLVRPGATGYKLVRLGSGIHLGVG